MSLWMQFGPEDPDKTQERVLAALEFQENQLARVVAPILADLTNRIAVQEAGLRDVYKPLTNHAKNRVKKNGKRLDQLRQQLRTDEVLQALEDNSDLLPVDPSTLIPPDVSESHELPQPPNLTPDYVPQPPPQPLPPPIIVPVPTPDVTVPFPPTLVPPTAIVGHPLPVPPQVMQPLGPVNYGPGMPQFGQTGPWLLPSMPGQGPQAIPPFDIPPPQPQPIGGLPPPPPIAPDFVIQPPPPIGQPPPQQVCCPAAPVNVQLNPVIDVKPNIIVQCPPTDDDDDEEKEETEETEDKLQESKASELPPNECAFAVMATQAATGIIRVEDDSFISRTISASGPPTDASALLCNPWEPDTENICFLIDTYIRRFTEIGEAAIRFLQEAATAYSHISQESETITNLLLNALLPISAALKPGQLTEIVINTVKNLSTSITSGMIVQGSAYVGLSLIKLVLETLESVTVGWNLGPMVMIQLRITLTKEKEVLEYLRNYLWPTAIPSSPDVSTLLVTGLISESHAECLWRMNSSLPRLERKLAYARRGQVTPDQLVRLYLRGEYSAETLYKRVREQGWQDSTNIDELVASQIFIPPPSDAVSMAVRDVFNPLLIGKQLMLDEYNQQAGLRELFRANGIGPVHIAGIKPDKQDIVDVGELYWLAHYANCSPTQVYEMLHRLRPGRTSKWALPGQTPEQTASMETDIETVRKLLQLNDYNPFWRDRLAAIAYRTLGRIDIRRFYATGVFGPPLGRAGLQDGPNGYAVVGVAEREIVEANLDAGYSPDDSRKHAIYTALDYDSKRLAPIRKAILSETCEALQIGYDTPAKAKERLIAAGIGAEEAALAVHKCDLARRVKQLKRAITYVRRAFLGGRLQEAGAEGILNELGLQPEVINDYLNEWSLDIRMRAKEPQAKQLCEWFGLGFLSLNEFIERLVRIGYSQQDYKRIIAHCIVGVQGKAAREQEKIAKLIAKNKKDLEARQRQRLREFLSARSEDHLKQWYADGTITIDDIRKTLLLKGWHRVDVERWIYSLTGVSDNGKPTEDGSETDDFVTAESEGTSSPMSGDTGNGSNDMPNFGKPR